MFGKYLHNQMVFTFCFVTELLFVVIRVDRLYRSPPCPFRSFVCVCVCVYFLLHIMFYMYFNVCDCCYVGMYLCVHSFHSVRCAQQVLQIVSRGSLSIENSLTHQSASARPCVCDNALTTTFVLAITTFPFNANYLPLTFIFQLSIYSNSINYVL